MMDDYVWESYNLVVNDKTSRSNLFLAWRFLLGVTAFLDFVANVLPPLLRSEGEMDDELLLENLLWEEYEILGHPIPDYPFGQMLKFLNAHCGIIGFSFSLMWFLEAFLDASREREKTIVERDRTQLLNQAQQQNNDEDDVGNISVVDDLGYLDDNYDSWLAFYLRLFWQLMMLPTGFYLLLSQGIYAISIWDGDDNGYIENMLRDTYDVQELTGSFTFHKERNLALGFNLFKFVLDGILNFLNEQGIVLKKIAVKEVSHLLRGVLTSAILHPRKFAKRMQNALTAIRWVKYLAPIIGTANKLKGNLQDLLKKRRQRREYLILQKVRQKVFRKMDTKKKREAAARRIQSCFRSHQVRKRIRAVKLLTAQKETMAAIKMQAIFRRKLEEARKRLKLKKLELEKLKKKAQDDLWKKAQQTQKKQMTAEERLRLYQLEEELHSESVKILNRRMLLKPNTRFSVTWKFLFVFCVVFEITGLVVNPFLKEKKDQVTGQPLTVDARVREVLVPLPVSELDECKCELPEIKGWRANLLGRKGGLQHKKSTPKTCGPFPWYCEAPYSTIRGFYIQAMDFLIEDFLVLVAWVMFLDVPISFLTGEFDESGSLCPKPFFARWILPGLLLQLLVNPKMKNTFDLLKNFIHFAFDVGIVRFWRWTMACFYPLFLAYFELMERLWIHVVEDQNHKTVFDEARSKIMGREQELAAAMAAQSKQKAE